jgi:nicotinamide-nucleotide amidase
LKSLDTLISLAETIGTRLAARKETIAIAESSTGGLISAALLAVPGASAYFLGGAVIYTAAARAALIALSPDEMKVLGLRPSTEDYAALLAARIRERHNATWGIGETGAAGPTGNRYGDAAGHSCIAIAGARLAATTIETGGTDRVGNMRVFARRSLELLAETIR